MMDDGVADNARSDDDDAGRAGLLAHFSSPSSPFNMAGIFPAKRIPF
jgi:hypothetical protein